MIKSFTIVNEWGSELELDLARPQRSGIAVKYVSGLGPVDATINATESATSDGSMYVNSRLSNRNIVFNLIFMEDNDLGETIEDIRQKTYKVFGQKNKITITAVTNNRVVSTEGYVETNTPNIFSKMEGCSISIICPDPYWYSSIGNGLQVTDFSSIIDSFEFPFSNEGLPTTVSDNDPDKKIIFGIIFTRAEQILSYQGEAAAGVVISIEFSGVAKNIKVYNTTTREVMSIDTDKVCKIINSDISSGDVIKVSTVRGNKYVRLVRGTKTYNILNAIGRSSSWFQINKGDNTFAFTAEEGIENLKFRIENRIVYWGV